MPHLVSVPYIFWLSPGTQNWNVFCNAKSLCAYRSFCSILPSIKGFPSIFPLLDKWHVFVLWITTRAKNSTSLCTYLKFLLTHCILVLFIYMHITCSLSKIYVFFLAEYAMRLHMVTCASFFYLHFSSPVQISSAFVPHWPASWFLR
jgi:hypothetical protein